MIQMKSPPENGAVSLDACGVTTTPPDWPPPDAAGALAPLPPLPEAPLVVPAAVEPPVPVVPLVPDVVPDEVAPADPPLGVPPPPVTGVDVSGATPWYCAWELDWARLAAGAARAKETARKRRQIRLLMRRL
jgi:hypothetical protein